MGEFYGKKIKNKVINKKTGSPWVIDDVPKTFKKATEDWLEAHKDNVAVEAKK